MWSEKALASVCLISLDGVNDVFMCAFWCDNYIILWVFEVTQITQKGLGVWGEAEG